MAAECTSFALQCIEMRPISSNALQCLVSIQQSSPRLLTRAEPRFPQSFINSPTVQKILQRLNQGDFSPEGLLVVDSLDAIIAQIDLSSPSYILSGQYTGVLQTLLVLLNCNGIAMLEDTVCQVILEAVVSIIEGYTDWESDNGALEHLKVFVRDAATSCLAKIQLPSEEMWNETQTWDADDRSRFQEFRLDMLDFLQSAFTILGSMLLEAIVLNVAKSTSQSSWPEFEASLFSLTAFADTMSGEPDFYSQMIEAIFNAEHFRLVLTSSDVPDRARNTSIRLLTETTALLQRHPDLMQILNFLFSSLHQSSSVGSASRAIYTLCDAQRSSLTPALADFISSLGTIVDLRGVERHRIYGGVAAIIQALPNESQKTEPLNNVLDFLSASLPLPTGVSTEEAIVRQSTDTLQTLAAVGRGLRTPTDAPLDLEASPSPDTGFWTNGPGLSTQQRFLGVYQELLKHTVSVSSDLIEAACDFLRSGFTEEHPSPLKLLSSKSTELIITLMSIDSPNIDAVMGTASSLLASADKHEFHTNLHQLLARVNSCLQELFLGQQNGQGLDDSSFPSAVLDFISRLLPKWIDSIMDVDGGSQFLEQFVDLALKVIADADTLPRRSAASFINAFVDVTRPGKLMSDSGSQALNNLIQSQSPRILAILLRLVGGECARSELEVLTDPLRRYVTHQPMLFKNICREAMKAESNVLTQKALLSTALDQRLRVVAQLDALRGGRKSNDVVKDFWIACRGSEFGYVV
jgi:hypothetical protein